MWWQYDNISKGVIFTPKEESTVFIKNNVFAECVDFKGKDDGFQWILSNIIPSQKSLKNLFYS